MTLIDNSKIFLEGVYADVEVALAANETLAKGTVLGRKSTGELVAFNSENTGSEPIYILAQDVTNETSEATSIDMVRVFDGGVVNKAKLIFANTDDASDVTVLDALKANGFKLEVVQEMGARTSLQ